MNVTQAALGTKKIQKGKIAKSESKTLQKVAKSREYTERKHLFCPCFDFQPRWRRQKRREKWFTSANVFLARKSLKRQVGEFVRKKDICVKQCAVQK